MSPATLGLWLAAFSALTTALAHASVKSGTDKLAVQAWVRLIGFSVACPVAMWIGAPPRDLLPWLFAAAAVHAVYQVALSWSYTATDFSVAYPIARGIAPLATAIAAAIALHEFPTPVVMTSIAVTSVGIIALASRQSIRRAGLVAAVATGLLTTAYTVIDAKGMRVSPDAVSFVAWFFVLDGFSMPLLFVAARRKAALRLLIANRRAGIAAGIMGPVSFIPALYALSLSPIGAVAAIRETSVLIGLVVGGRLLGEQVDRFRIVGAVLIICGTLGIILSSIVN